MSEDESGTQRGGKKWVVLGLLIGIPLLVTALQVDDWSRDLTTNTAATRVDHPDETLRPLRDPHTRAEIVAAVKAAAKSLSGWELRGEEPTETTTTLLFTRTSGLFKFVDDVRVRVVDHGDYRVVGVGSESRVGEADLGQNPRNIRTLLAAMDKELGL